MSSAASVGIFWFVQLEDEHLAMPLRTSLLKEAEEYGDCLTFAEGHYETWQAWREGVLCLNPPSSELHRAIVLSEYEEWPRGRVVYERTPAYFVVYADRQSFPHQSRILEAFRLPAERTRMLTDSHYQSTRRINTRQQGPRD